MKCPSVLVAACLAAAIVPLGGAAAADRPNFVVIFIDDLGYGDIGPFGATRQKTPNLDRMAAEGRKFTSFYAAPVCSVSRAQLLTGCYGLRVGVPGVYFPAGPEGLNPAEVTLAEHLKPLGYATACIGKWHLGDQPEFLPTRQGFDRYLGIPYSNDMQKVAAETGEPVVPLLRDDKVTELLRDEDQRGIVERSTDEAVRFIRDSKDRPFFLYLPHTAVHLPHFPGDRFRDTSGNGAFGDWVAEMDWSVGRVLEALREHGLDEKTLVVFTSDNGPWIGWVKDVTSAGPLRGCKGSTWEGGVRVPTIVRWPGRIPAGTACDAVAGTIDLVPTLVALAGGSVPDEPVIDGRDLSGLLFGTSVASPREAHYYFAGGELQAVRQGRWKLAVAGQPVGFDRKGPKVPASPEAPRLYDLEADVGETTDVAAGHADVVERLRGLANRMAAELVDPASPARRPPGRVEHPTTLYPVKEKPRAAPPPGKPARAASFTRKPRPAGELPVIGTDFFPTVLAAVGLEPPQGVTLDGVNLLPALAGGTVERPVPMCWRWGGKVAWREDAWKLVTNDRLERPELYDLAADRGETRDLAAAEPDRVAALLGRLRAYLAEVEAEGPGWWRTEPGDGARPRDGRRQKAGTP